MTDPLVAARYRLDSVIATVDAATALQTFDRRLEAVKQAAVADRLLTKTDLADPDTVAAVEARLRTLNPAAPILRTAGGAVEPSQVFEAGLYNPTAKGLDVQRWLNAEAYAAGDGHEHGGHHHHNVNRHGDDIGAV